jgi:16S rRNA (guanine1207-N2)-methyltransferase
MSHYYTKDNDRLDSDKHPVRFVVKGHQFTLNTDKGVFSKSGLDFGSRVLLETIETKVPESVLDLGCGYGPIGIVIKKLYGSKVTMVDINDRAVRLATENSKLNFVTVNVFQSDGFASVIGKYDWVITNPPIRAGKQIIYGWFDQAKAFLNDTGRLVIVINKNQGAPSAITYLNTIYSKVDVIAKKSGYHVISCQK